MVSLANSECNPERGPSLTFDLDIVLNDVEIGKIRRRGVFPHHLDRTRYLSSRDSHVGTTRLARLLEHAGGAIRVRVHR